MPITTVGHLRKAIHSLSEKDKNKLIEMIAFHLFEVEDSKLDLNKEVDGGDFVEFVTQRFSLKGIVPEGAK